ncbi:hypothetical protein BGY98DRAFT_991406 [Russula aff. rugulosa BPL654]|nr:hypothetical protein BGY98DRAFT_991406 [Russula aff. rugulosa BPL654]
MLLTQFRSILLEGISSYLNLHPNSTIRPRCLENSDSRSNRFCQIHFKSGVISKSALFTS